MKNATSGMLRHVSLVRTDVSEELSASVISVRRLPVKANVVLSAPILVTLMIEAVSSSETSVLTRATRRNIPEDSILKYMLPYSHQNSGQIREIVISNIRNKNKLRGPWSASEQYRLSMCNIKHAV
jgi:hypothetical protein